MTGIHRFALLLGRNALVLKELHINEHGSPYITLIGRKAGLISWVLTVVGINTVSTFTVYDRRATLTKSALSGSVTQAVPFASAATFGIGFLKPILLLFGAVAGMVACIYFFCFYKSEFSGRIGGACLLISVILTVFFFIQKSLLIYITSNSGDGITVIFKRSLIEAVNVSKADADKASDILTRLIEGNQMHTSHAAPLSGAGQPPVASGTGKSSPPVSNHPPSSGSLHSPKPPGKFWQP